MSDIDKKEPTGPTSSPSKIKRKEMLLWGLLLAGGVAVGVGYPYWSSHINKNASVPAPLSEVSAAAGSPAIVVINSGKIATQALEVVNKNPKFAPLRARSGEVGGLVGKSIREISRKYAQQGVIVLDSSLTLGYPDSIDVTPIAERAVLSDLMALAAQTAPSASASSPTAPSSYVQPAQPTPMEEGRLP